MSLFRVAPHDPPSPGVVHLLKDDEKGKDEDYNADVILEPDWAVVGITPGGVYGMLKKKWPKAMFNQELCDLLVLDEASQMNLPEALMAALLAGSATAHHCFWGRTPPSSRPQKT